MRKCNPKRQFLNADKAKSNMEALGIGNICKHTVDKCECGFYHINIVRTKDRKYKGRKEVDIIKTAQ